MENKFKDNCSAYELKNSVCHLKKVYNFLKNDAPQKLQKMYLFFTEM